MSETLSSGQRFLGEFPRQVCHQGRTLVASLRTEHHVLFEGVKLRFAGQLSSIGLQSNRTAQQGPYLATNLLDIYKSRLIESQDVTSVWLHHLTRPVLGSFFFLHPSIFLSPSWRLESSALECADVRGAVPARSRCPLCGKNRQSDPDSAEHPHQSGLVTSTLVRLDWDALDPHPDQLYAARLRRRTSCRSSSGNCFAQLHRLSMGWVCRSVPFFGSKGV